MDNKEQIRRDKGIRITIIGFIVNLILAIFKIVAGVVGKSAAMLADGIHSFSDFITDFIVILFLKISSKEKDDGHHYGHGKFETFATLIISLVLIFVGGKMLYDNGEKIYRVINGDILERPGIIALIAALLSIVLKESLFRITIKIGEEINSTAVIANGWHHRSDALSSIGTSLGIAGAIFLGARWRVLDPIASVVVSFFIIKVALEIIKPALDELLESALDKNIEKEIIDIISSTAGVKAMHNLKTRKSGGTYIIDVHIKVTPTITIVEAHDIATAVEVNLRERYGCNTQTSIHTEPYYI